MHEMAIAASVVEHVLKVAEQAGAVRIEAVELEIGVLQLVVPEALELAFAAATQDTRAAGAKLKMTPVAALAECRQCGLRFEPAIDNYLCPHCQQADVQVVAGRDILLKSVMCEMPESAAAS